MEAHSGAFDFGVIHLVCMQGEGGRGSLKCVCLRTRGGGGGVRVRARARVHKYS